MISRGKGQALSESQVEARSEAQGKAQGGRRARCRMHSASLCASPRARPKEWWTKRCSC